MNTQSQVTPTFQVSNISVKQDAEGRYCLNDLHRASGFAKKHRPQYWIDNQQTKELIAELENSKAGIPALATKHGGSDRGTYVAKELVYAYAMWISPKFHLQVIRAYDALQRPTLPASSSNSIDLALTLPIGKIRYLITNIDGQLHMKPIPDDAYVMTAAQIQKNIPEIFPDMRLVSKTEHALMTVWRDMVIEQLKESTQ